jgi:guanylate kinase
MIILTGPSASGKTEIAKILGIKYNIKKVITHPTRPMRVNEKPCVDYDFVDETTFVQLQTQHAFVETTLYNNHHYGTSYAEIGPHKVLIVDPQGLAAFLKIKDPSFVTFFIQASEVTRINRMIMRGQDLNFAKQRIAFDHTSFSQQSLPPIDYVINNESVTIEVATDTIHQLYLQKTK